MLKSSIIEYFKNTLGIVPEVELFEKKSVLPLYLHHVYELYTIRLYDHTFLLAQKSLSDRGFTPADICKHMNMLHEYCGMNAILVIDLIDSFLRKKLIEHKISFIVPGKQMYLPLLMIDLKEIFSGQRKILETVSPSTQFVLLYDIYHSLPRPFTPKETGERLGYTKMTMSRVVDELENLSICRVEERGRNRYAWIELENRALWDKVVNYLRSPVKRKMHIVFLSAEMKKTNLVKAGVSALAEKTTLASYGMEVYAACKEQFDGLILQKKIKIAEHEYEADGELELWHYNPLLLTGRQIADDLSLFLAMKDEKDERIQLSLKELMGNHAWQ